MGLLTSVMSTSLDEDYIVVGNHIDKSMRNKIANSEYVDFAKLIPRDRFISGEEDHCMEMVNRNGMSFWMPVADRGGMVISNFSKWEQAFCVFANVYTHFYPDKAGDLIQYNHIIHTAAQTFVWDNVYCYDREFHIHLSRHHPHRSWSIILQQAWSMYLKEKITTPTHQGHNSGNKSGNARRKLCFDYNRGHCQYSQRCRFDHRYSFCNKFGHGFFNCRKAAKAYANAGTNTNISKDRDDKDHWDKYEKEQMNNVNKNNNNK